MDRNTIIGLLLILAIFIGYTIYTSPSEEERIRRQQVQDSIVRVQERQARIQDSLQRLAPEPEKQSESITPEKLPQNESAVESELINRLGYFAGAGVGEQKYFILENEKIKLKISNVGGKIISAELKEYQTYDSLPLLLYNSEKTTFGYTFFANNRSISTDGLYFKPEYSTVSLQGKDSMYVSGSDSLRFSLRLYADAGDGKDRYIEYVYTIFGDKYMVDYDLNLVGMDRIVDPGTGFLNLSWKTEMRRQEKSLENDRRETSIYYKYYQDDVDYLSESSDDEENIVTKVKWVSFKSRFFLSAFIADNAFENADVRAYTREDETDPHYLRNMEAEIGVPFQNLPSQQFATSFYFGPNKYKTLKKFDLELERQIPLGWSFFLLAWINRYAVIPVFDWLGGYGWNYGIVILILTILLKIVLFPIAYKTYLSSARMRVLKPEVEELSKKFPKQEDAMKKQQATMALYKKAGVNPMAGCLPMLLQMPILIAMFRFFPSSIELRQESFLWAHDLSSYDSILDLPFNIPFYGDHVSLFTLLMTISTIIYTRINNDMMGSANTQMPGMKTMMYLMPIMFLGFFNSYASGLSYYYLLANLITFGQMFIIRRTIDEVKIRKQILANKKKPVKKSGFQKRLEDMAKQRGYDPKTGKRK